MDIKEAMAADAAKALRMSAKDHKRASAFHRRSARKCMEKLAELEQRCREAGIKLIIEGEDPKEGSWPRNEKKS